ncbi:hypothetical protein NXS19_001836 [Fusarium pseudograminearum]|nr:hypothetical protein NXS19_001836 [Fusarium pseudograminearum]
MTKVLLTGGSGFIAAHTLEQLLEKDYSIVTTVRSEDKAQKIRNAFPDKVKDGKLEIVIVTDIAKPDAFDQVAKTPGLDAVVHVASPFHFNITDPKKDLIDPAVIGTTGILKALHASAPNVKRVVITSSFAAIIDEAKFTDGSHVFSEKTWNPVTIDDIARSDTTAYRASKTLAERAAWDFVAEKKPSFDLVTVCPPLVLGPVSKHLATLESINTSNARIVNLLRGEWKDEIPPCTPVPLWIDVRDAARAHVRGLEEPSAGGSDSSPQQDYSHTVRLSTLLLKNSPSPRIGSLGLKSKAENFLLKIRFLESIIRRRTSCSRLIGSPWKEYDRFG